MHAGARSVQPHLHDQRMITRLLSAYLRAYSQTRMRVHTVRGRQLRGRRGELKLQAGGDDIYIYIYIYIYTHVHTHMYMAWLAG